MTHDQAMLWSNGSLPAAGSIVAERLDTIFTAPAMFGETLEFHLHAEDMGKSVLVLQHHVFGPDRKIRWRARQHLVATSLSTHRHTPWPEDVRQAIQQFMEIS